MTHGSKASSSSQRTSPFRDVTGYAAEQLSSSSMCSSPDENNFDGIKLEETEAWSMKLCYSTKLSGVVLAVCPYLDRFFLASAGCVVSCELLLYIFYWTHNNKMHIIMHGLGHFMISHLIVLGA